MIVIGVRQIAEHCSVSTYDIRALMVVELEVIMCGFCLDNMQEALKVWGLASKKDGVVRIF